MKDKVRIGECFVYDWDLQGPLDGVIARLTELRERYGGKVELELEAEAGIDVYLMRDETDEEYARRQEKSAHVRELADKQEYEHFLRLKEKYEGSFE